MGVGKWDKERLESGRWLNSSLINAAQKLIKKAYPHVNGLQDTQASRTALPDGDFVQTLHVNNSQNRKNKAILLLQTA